jgi:hypothetical protein
MSSQVADLSGKRFGRLTVVRRIPGSAPGAGSRVRARWLCRCECGGSIKTRTNNLTVGDTKSCGCLLAEVQATNGYRNVKHGGSGTLAYWAWWAMIKRCHNPNSKSFKHYGARGIRVCSRWRSSFEDFIKDVGPRPPGRTLDRINNDGDYEPGNVRWATAREQVLNSRPRTRRVNP